MIVHNVRTSDDYLKKHHRFMVELILLLDRWLYLRSSQLHDANKTQIETNEKNLNVGLGIITGYR